MGKKKITKEPKSAKGKGKQEEKEQVDIVPEPTSAKKKNKKNSKSSSQISIFSQSFQNRISQFKNFYNDFLSKKAESDSIDLDEELEKVTDNVSGKIEQACSAVLKEDLKQAQEWIEQQQKSVQMQIDKISSAYQDTKNTLTNTGTFTQEEVLDQLKPLENKKQNLQINHDNYGSLHERAGKIYSLGNMDEQ